MAGSGEFMEFYSSAYGISTTEVYPSAPEALISYISPHSTISNKIKRTGRFYHDKAMNIPVIFTASFGLLFGPVETFSILRNVSMPSMTLPKTTCFPSRKSHGAVVTKNFLSHIEKDEVGKRLFWKTCLAAVRVGPRVGLFGVSLPRQSREDVTDAHHRQKAGAGMFHLEILVLDNK
jgi:hypothetical protein